MESFHVMSVEGHGGGIVVAKQAGLDRPLRAFLHGSSTVRFSICRFDSPVSCGRSCGLWVRWALDGGRSLLSVGDLCTAETLNDMAELVLGFGIHGVLLNRNRVAKRERGAHDGRRVVIVMLAARRKLSFVLGAGEMVLVGVLAVVGLLADITGAFEEGLVGLGVGDSARLEDLLAEDFGRDGRQGCYSSLEVVPAVTRVVSWCLRDRGGGGTYCQSLFMCAFCRSMLRYATWQVLQV